MTTLLAALAWVAMVGGATLVVIGALGILRLPEFFSRLHAASVTDTLGAGLMVVGLMIHAGPGMPSVKLVLIVVFLFFTGPVATHALAKAALHGRLTPEAEDLRD